MSSKNSPCLDCENRCLLCHKGCYNYKEYKIRLEKIKKAKKLRQELFVTHYIARRYLNLYG